MTVFIPYLSLLSFPDTSCQLAVLDHAPETFVSAIAFRRAIFLVCYLSDRQYK